MNESVDGVEVNEWLAADLSDSVEKDVADVEFPALGANMLVEFKGRPGGGRIEMAGGGATVEAGGDPDGDSEVSIGVDVVDAGGSGGIGKSVGTGGSDETGSAGIGSSEGTGGTSGGGSTVTGGMLVG